MQAQRFESITSEAHSTFDEPVEFNQEQMEKLLDDPNVENVHVFKATPRNMKMAALRQKYPDLTRKQLRKLL